MIPQEICNFRGHIESITCVSEFECSGNLTLVSSDSRGWIFWWDMKKRRPISVWRGHQASIISLFQASKNILISHSRDSDIKLWNLSDYKNCNPVIPERVSTNSSNQVADDDFHEKTNPAPEFKVIPVNALSYCNVAYSNGYLITPATTNSNNFDIYQLFANDDHLDESSLDDLDLKRVSASVDPVKLYERYSRHKPLEENLDEGLQDMSKRGGFGIIMRIMWINSDTFYLGFESGHILGLSIRFDEMFHEKITEVTTGSSKLVLNKEPKISVIYYSNASVPNPILSMAYSPDKNSVLCGSTSKYIYIHPTAKHETTGQSEVFENLRHSGIQSISVESGLTVVGFWSGYVKGYSLEFEQKFKYSSKLPQIECLESNEGQAKETAKSSVLKLTHCHIVSSGGIKSNAQLIQRRLSRNDIRKKNLLVLGYSDGTIKILELFDK
ncbi:Piso0_005554 [Millerozyma farinosa CBS 7064]|uniref:ASTRA-associated protein 1 n=1 Tax=Pichia sorbitophila (strain ATCC MYA-4447 / BCRC 22081 / CBS 7064 / NBRC 10061 / NRRL Y-12695) TaxID=559304 RepID=G8XZB1_PICSO|nr:Piso0_005554 [Millerozyma farinosa CBS 7064]